MTVLEGPTGAAGAANRPKKQIHERSKKMGWFTREDDFEREATREEARARAERVRRSAMIREEDVKISPFIPFETDKSIDDGFAKAVHHSLNELDTDSLRAYLTDREKEFSSGIKALDDGIAGLEAKRENKRRALIAVRAALGTLEELEIVDQLEIDGQPENDDATATDQSAVEVGYSEITNPPKLRDGTDGLDRVSKQLRDEMEAGAIIRQHILEPVDHNPKSGE